MSTSTPTSYVATNTNPQYHADVDIYSSSMLKAALDSPAAFIQSLLVRYTGTKATDNGSLMHALVLEPHTVNDLVAIFPDTFTRAKESTEFKEKNKGRYCLSLSEFVSAQNLADKVVHEKFRGRPFHQFISEGIVERSIYYTDPVTGLKCRTRPDLFHPEFTFDLKTTRYSDLSRFNNQAVSLHYDLSAFMYSLARILYEQSETPATKIDAKPFVLIPVCTEAPHSVFFAPASNNFIANGQKKYEHAIAIIKACSQVNSWPAMGGEQEIDIAPWQVYSADNSRFLHSSI